MTTFHCPAHPFGEATGLDCQREDAHRPNHGCRYESSYVPDGHDASEARND